MGDRDVLGDRLRSEAGHVDVDSHRLVRVAIDHEEGNGLAVGAVHRGDVQIGDVVGELTS